MGLDFSNRGDRGFGSKVDKRLGLETFGFYDSLGIAAEYHRRGICWQSSANKCTPLEQDSFYGESFLSSDLKVTQEKFGKIGIKPRKGCWGKMLVSKYELTRIKKGSRTIDQARLGSVGFRLLPSKLYNLGGFYLHSKQVRFEGSGKSKEVGQGIAIRIQAVLK